MPVQLPIRVDLLGSTNNVSELEPASQDAVSSEESENVASQPPTLEAEPTISNLETPLNSDEPSDDDSTQPTTPSSIIPQSIAQPQRSHASKVSHPTAVALPFLPAIPLASRAPKRPSMSASSVMTKPPEQSTECQTDVSLENESRPDSANNLNTLVPAASPISPHLKPAPKSWAELVRTSAQKTLQKGSKAEVNGTTNSNGFNTSRVTSLAEVLSSYKVDEVINDSRVIFLQPRGLVNTGNMCYMNSVCVYPSLPSFGNKSLIIIKVLQILVFCVPFYDFLERVSRQAVHTFKTETPLVDAM